MVQDLRRLLDSVRVHSLLIGFNFDELDCAGEFCIDNTLFACVLLFLPLSC